MVTAAPPSLSFLRSLSFAARCRRFTAFPHSFLPSFPKIEPARKRAKAALQRIRGAVLCCAVQWLVFEFDHRMECSVEPRTESTPTRCSLGASTGFLYLCALSSRSVNSETGRVATIFRSARPKSCSVARCAAISSTDRPISLEHHPPSSPLHSRLLLAPSLSCRFPTRAFFTALRYLFLPGCFLPAHSPPCLSTLARRRYLKQSFLCYPRSRTFQSSCFVSSEVRYFST